MRPEGAMSIISAVGNTDLELDHRIARVTLPATTRLPDRSSGDRAPQTPEQSRRHRAAPNLPHRKSNPNEDERFDEEPSPRQSPAEEAQLYSPSQKADAAYPKDQTQHNVDIRA